MLLRQWQKTKLSQLRTIIDCCCLRQFYDRDRKRGPGSVFLVPPMVIWNLQTCKYVCPAKPNFSNVFDEWNPFHSEEFFVGLISGKSALVYLMAWCLMATSHYLCQCCKNLWWAGVILCMLPANEGWCYIVTVSLTGWAHTQNYPWIYQNTTLSHNHTTQCDAQTNIMTISLWQISHQSYTTILYTSINRQNKNMDNINLGILSVYLFFK